MYITYEIIKSSRKTIAVEVRQDGSVLVRAPRNCPQSRIDTFLKEKQAWVLAKVEEQKEKEADSMKIQPLSEAEQRLYRDKAREIFEQKVSYYAQMMGVSYGRIAIRDQKTRWGSCSGEGNLNFNWRLIFAPAGVLDYVVVHELAHRKEMNHSPRFWRVVEDTMPEYRKYQKWLKENGRGLHRY
ncbi:M48 family metallopeptidase [Bariatricus sp. HCP28S3_C2]|uniref:M48 family metallopeptidase n=1 Tax=unclassified Bariatricus TaxID=2677046 RepID=UPI002A94D014|nr:SprT family zinc-dependent metalloprotease [bacterium]MDY5458084.1 SprT family zinc-dependent metalloprotease [Bariatricus sp.]